MKPADNPVITIDTSRISDWDSFHAVFTEVFGFPGFYGKNAAAWIDCMTCLDDPSAEMSQVHCAPGQVVTLKLDSARDLASRCPEVFSTLQECAAFVNWRRLERGQGPVLALAYSA